MPFRQPNGQKHVDYFSFRFEESTSWCKNSLDFYNQYTYDTELPYLPAGKLMHSSDVYQYTSPL